MEPHTNFGIIWNKLTAHPHHSLQCFTSLARPAPHVLPSLYKDTIPDFQSFSIHNICLSRVSPLCDDVLTQTSLHTNSQAQLLIPQTLNKGSLTNMDLLLWKGKLHPWSPGYPPALQQSLLLISTEDAEDWIDALLLQQHHC